MDNESSAKRGLTAGIMGLGMLAGVLGYFFAAFVLKIPGFESAPIMIGCWVVALLLASVVAPKRAKS